MSRILDISVPLDETIPSWPDSPGLQVERWRDLGAGDAATVTRLRLDVHVGTHVDAPSHALPGGATLDRMVWSESVPRSSNRQPPSRFRSACS